MKISIELTPEEAKEIMNKKHWEDFVQRWIADDRAADMLPDEPDRKEKLRQAIRTPNTDSAQDILNGIRYASYNYHKPARSDHPGLDGEDD